MFYGRSKMKWGISDRASRIHAEALIWDNHAGFAYEPDVDLKDLERWREAGVDYVSVNVGFDVPPWNKLAIEALSSYRRQIREQCDSLIQVRIAEDVVRAKAEGKLAVAFDLEGMDALNGDPGMVEIFYDLGVRQMLVAYNRNNLAGGGCHDEDTGLTDFGRDVVKEMNRVGMVVDCTHCGFKTTMDVMRISTSPVVFSHSNARAVRDHERNITDEQITACAATGGIVAVTGVGLFIGPNGANIDDLVRHIDHMVELVGSKHVGLGMDSVFRVGELSTILKDHLEYWPARQYPDAKTDFILPESFPKISAALLTRGYNEEYVRNILGENFFRLVRRIWK
jgi:membrane dipeptidase